MNSQKSYTGKINLIKEGKKIDIGEVIKHNEIINKSLKFKTMPSYCLKCRKNTESINPRVSKTNGKTIILSKLQYVVQDLLKNKNQVEYLVI